LLRNPYKRNEYRKVILPLTVLRRFDCLLAPTKAVVLKQHAAVKSRPETVARSLLEKGNGRPFYNLSPRDPRGKIRPAKSAFVDPRHPRLGGPGLAVCNGGTRVPRGQPPRKSATRGQSPLHPRYCFGAIFSSLFTLVTPSTFFAIATARFFAFSDGTVPRSVTM
jgi:hypothetical protein